MFNLFGEGQDMGDYLRYIQQRALFLSASDLAYSSRQDLPNVKEISSEEFEEGGILYKSTLWKYYDRKMPIYYTTTEFVQDEYAKIQDFQAKMERAIVDSRFEEAAAYRDKINKLKNK